MEALDGTTSLATYRYNGLGQRVQKDTGTLTAFVYGTEGQLLGDYQDDGTAIREYVYLNGEPIAQINGAGPAAEVLYLHTDHLGTPRRATNASGTAVWAWDSDAFGATAANEDVDGDGTSVTVPIRFPGQYYDQETGLHYNYFRYYDPGTGRYLTSDPIGLQGGLNTYSYALSNPVKYSDPSGLLVQFCATPPTATACLKIASGIVNTIGAAFVLLNSLDFGDAANDDKCHDPDDPCYKQQAKLNVEKVVIKRLYTRASDPRVGASNYRAVVDNFNERVKKHNDACPNYPVDKLPRFPQDLPPDQR